MFIIDLDPDIKELGQKLKRIEREKTCIKNSLKLRQESAIYLELEKEYDSDVVVSFILPLQVAIILTFHFC